MSQTVSSGGRIRAFTLVELLVVIGIIAILIGILLPTISRARQVSRRSACLSNMRQIGAAVLMFAQEHKLYVPKAYYNSAPLARDYAAAHDYANLRESWGYRSPEWGWDFLLLRYVKNNKDVFRCPSDDSDIVRTGDLPASYRLNGSNQTDEYKAYKLTQIKHSAQAILLVEGLPVDFHHIATWEKTTGFEEARVSKFWRVNMAYKRHPKEMNNYAFVDGHAETLAWEDTWKPIGPPPKSGQAIISPAHQGITMWRQRYAPRPGMSAFVAVMLDQWWANTLTPPDN